jgi:hypothetical protein
MTTWSVGRLERRLSEIAQSHHLTEFETLALYFTGAFFTNAKRTFGTKLICFLSGDTQAGPTKRNTEGREQTTPWTANALHRLLSREEVEAS